MGLLSSGVKAVSKALSTGKKARTIVGKAGAKRKGINEAFEKKLKALPKLSGEKRQRAIHGLNEMKEKNVIAKPLVSGFNKEKKKKIPIIGKVKKSSPEQEKRMKILDDKELDFVAKRDAMKEAEKVMGIGKGDWDKKRGGVVKKAGGGMTRQGLYPAEMARAGTMSQAKRKKNMKKGGSISYKMTGGQVVSHNYD